jgi:hypothetical protein
MRPQTTHNPSRLPPELLNQLEEDLWTTAGSPPIQSATRSLQMLGIAPSPPVPAPAPPTAHTPQLLSNPQLAQHQSMLATQRHQQAMELAYRLIEDPDLFLKLDRMVGPAAYPASATTYQPDLWTQLIHFGALVLMAGLGVAVIVTAAQQNPTSARQTDAMLDRMERMNAQNAQLAREVAKSKRANNVCILSLDCPQ